MIRKIYFAHCKDSFDTDFERLVRIKLAVNYTVFCPNRDMVSETSEMSEYNKKASEADAVFFTMSRPGWISRGVHSEVFHGKTAYLVTLKDNRLFFTPMDQLTIKVDRRNWIEYATIRGHEKMGGSHALPR